MHNLSVLATDTDHARQRRWQTLVAAALRNRAAYLAQLGDTEVAIGPILLPANVHAVRMLELAQREEPCSS